MTGRLDLGPVLHATVVRIVVNGAVIFFARVTAFNDADVLYVSSSGVALYHSEMHLRRDLDQDGVPTEASLPTPLDLVRVDSVSRSLSQSQMESLLTLWNTLQEIADAVRPPFAFSGKVADSAYSKLFWGSRPESVTPPGMKCSPAWKSIELSKIVKVVRSGMRRLERAASPALSESLGETDQPARPTAPVNCDGVVEMISSMGAAEAAVLQATLLASHLDVARIEHVRSCPAHVRQSLYVSLVDGATLKPLQDQRVEDWVHSWEVAGLLDVTFERPWRELSGVSRYSFVEELRERSCACRVITGRLWRSSKGSALAARADLMALLAHRGEPAPIGR